MSRNSYNITLCSPTPRDGISITNNKLLEMNVLLSFETLQNINVFIQSGIIYGLELNKH